MTKDKVYLYIISAGLPPGIEEDSTTPKDFAFY